MSNNPSGKVYEPIPIDQAENLTEQLVTPILQLTKYDVSLDHETGKANIQANPKDTIKALFYWQAIISAIVMRQHSMAVLEHLMQIRSLDQQLMSALQNDIHVADDNLAVMSEKMLTEFGIKI